MLCKVYGSAVVGIDAVPVTIEVNIDNGIGYHLVGLPDNAIREIALLPRYSIMGCVYRVKKSP